MVDLPKSRIGNLEFNLIQGGMGLKISLSGLASAVANCGGIGIIASVGLGERDFPGGYAQANADGLKKEIKKAREKSQGIIGVNAMVGLTDYESLVLASVEAGVDLLITGAGFCENLPEIVGDSPMKLVPITSYGRFAGKMCETWADHGRLPDAIIVEGPKAGGHLGFGRKKLEKLDFVEGALEKEVVNTLKEVEKFGNIPVIAAGGIYTGQDIKKALSWGASGVQMATRFVTTLECDADEAFKMQYLNSTPENIVLIDSPLGLPGRAVDNDFLRKIKNGEKIDFNCPYNCLKSCKPKESPYCIAEALDNAQNGNFKEGFAFAGANAYRCTPETCLDESGKFITVETLMQRISDEYHSSE